MPPGCARATRRHKELAVLCPFPRRLPAAAKMATRRTAWLGLVLCALVCQLVLARTAARLRDDAPPGVRPRAAAAEDDGPGTLLNIDYSAWYFATHSAHRPLAFVALVLWYAGASCRCSPDSRTDLPPSTPLDRAGFLFSTIGITASDFFCPNLATVADRLGLGESTAGVTFLAFGNGSPDVFSTFSALKSDSFALAIGELLGASAFITSIVVGSMALVQPFHVPRWPFLRDVGFFTCAVMILVACLKDGKLTLPETGGLVAMYVLYVGIVVGGNWWNAQRRQRREERAKALAQAEDYFSQPGSVDAPPAAPPPLEHTQLLKPTDALRGGGGGRSRSISNASHASTADISPLATPFLLSRRSSAGTLTPSHLAAARPPIDQGRPAFSLLGAIEFRDAINALRKESAAAAAAAAVDSARPLTDAGQRSGQRDDLLAEPSFVADYFGGASPYPSGHYHSLHGHGHHHARATATAGGRSPSRPAHSRQVSSSFRSSRPETTESAMPPVKRLGPPSRIESTPVVPGGKAQTRVYDVRRASADAVRDLGPREDDGWTGEQAPATPPLPPPPPPPPAVSSSSLHDVEPDSIPLLSDSSIAPPPKTPDPPTWARTARHTAHILFPALQGFHEKSISGKILGIFASPAILALTLTLPVVDDAAEGVALHQGGGIALGEDEPGPPPPPPPPPGDERFATQREAEDGVIVHHSEDAEREDAQRVMGQAGRDLHRRMLAPGEVVTPQEDKDPSETCSDRSEDEVLLFNKYLTAVQSVLGTLFCACVMFCESCPRPGASRTSLIWSPCSRKHGGQIHHSALDGRGPHARRRHHHHSPRRHGSHMASDSLLCGILFGHALDCGDRR